LPKEGLLISETGAFICMLEHLWLVEQPGTYYSSSGGRTMGLTLPAVIGARLANPDRPMVGLGADGSLLMRLGELEVFARAGIGVPLIIVNDQALGTMKSRQRSRGLPDFGLDLHDVDFSMVARACGLRGVTVSTPEDFRRELQLALQSSQTTLIDARVDRAAYHDSFGPTIGVLN
jgi:thiamine pyrophosphate-dependent acetolactate synthase large subunit-like protein